MSADTKRRPACYNGFAFIRLPFPDRETISFFTSTIPATNRKRNFVDERQIRPRRVAFSCVAFADDPYSFLSSSLLYFHEE